MANKDRREIAKAVIAVTEAGISVLSPLALLLIGAKLCVKYFGWSEKVVVGAIVLGAVCGVYNMFTSIYKLAVKNKKKKETGEKDV
ncbi:MAG: hypothetical protein E7384_00675 [Ruminococcaceae bacterium]|nr:hypothetical protein [Oscillospiraceae bacterium]